MDIVPTILDLLLVLFLIFMNGFFVAGEFCCVKMRSSRLETLIAEGVSRAKYAKQLTDHLDSSLSVTQLGITLASLGLGWVGEPAIALLILPLTRSVGLPDDVGHTVALAIAFTLITSMHIVLGELTPKSMAIANVEHIMLTIAFPMVLFGRVMKPFVWVLNSIANGISRHLGYEVTGENEDAHTEEEIRLLMKESYRQGLINSTEADFVDNVFSFTELNAREIMVPRTDMICLYLDDTPAERIKTILEEQQTRYPVCYEDKDHIIGFIHVKDLLPPLVRGERLNLRRYIRKALVVPESMDGSVLLRTMQAQGSQLAIVVDEYGGTAGMVTVEDIVEQIVGDIRDEFDEESVGMRISAPSTRSFCSRRWTTCSASASRTKTSTASAAGSMISWGRRRAWGIWRRMRGRSSSSRRWTAYALRACSFGCRREDRIRQRRPSITRRNRNGL